IVSAPTDKMDKIRSVVNKLDVASKLDAASDNEPAQQPIVVPLRFVEPDKTLEEALRLLFPPSGFGPGHGNFTLDRQRKAVILWGEERETKAATEILDKLEKQSAKESGKSNPQVQVRVVWLVNDVPHQEASKLPEDLKEVLPALAKLGIEKPRLAAQ